MKMTVTKCDGCRTEIGVQEYKLDCGSMMDSSGNGYSTLWNHKDWCWTCFKDYILSSPKPLELLKSVELV